MTNKVKEIAHLFHRGRAASGRKRVAVVLTDGISQDSVRRPARRLRATGCEVFVLGIGRGYRKSQLRQIATDGSHVFTVSFKSLGQVIQQIKTKACQRIPSKFTSSDAHFIYRSGHLNLRGLDFIASSPKLTLKIERNINK